MDIQLSLITSIYNGKVSKELKEMIKLVESESRVELIIVNSGDKLSLVSTDNIIVSEIKTNLRAQRLNHGAQLASSQKYLFVHPRSTVEKEALYYLISNNTIYWGGLTHCFDKNTIFFKFTSWYSNHVRAKLRQIFYLDHCLYVRKPLFDEIGGFPLLSIFEDTAISENLAQLKYGELLPFHSQTSSIRFEKNGVIRQGLLNQVLKVAYILGVDHDRMNKIYEKGLELNSKY